MDATVHHLRPGTYPIGLREPVTGPGQSWSADNCPRLPATMLGNTVLKVAIDSFTKWVEVEKKTSNGAGMNLADPPGLPTGAATNTMGARKVGRRVDVHYLDLEVAGVGKQRCEVSNAAWKKYADGAAATVQVKVRTNNIDCDSL